MCNLSSQSYSSQSQLAKTKNEIEERIEDNDDDWYDRYPGFPKKGFKIRLFNKKNEQYIDAYARYSGKEKGIAELDILWVDGIGNRKKGYGSRLFQAAIINMYQYYNPVEITWSANPLDRNTDLKTLLQFYQSNGAVLVLKEEENAQMEYPLKLAATLSVIRPIFLAQKKPKKMKYKPENDPWKIIVSYCTPEDFGYMKRIDTEGYERAISK